MAQVDPDTTRLVGRWHIDTMLRYLHTTAKSFTDVLTIQMFHYRNYVLILPAHADVERNNAHIGLVMSISKGLLGAWYIIDVASAK